eukprot:scaffold123428_cov63-Phaeocystis_antarctica.AAC.1
MPAPKYTASGRAPPPASARIATCAMALPRFALLIPQLFVGPSSALKRHPPLWVFFPSKSPGPSGPSRSLQGREGPSTWARGRTARRTPATLAWP